MVAALESAEGRLDRQEMFDRRAFLSIGIAP